MMGPDRSQRKDASISVGGTSKGRRPIVSALLLIQIWKGDYEHYTKWQTS